MVYIQNRELTILPSGDNWRVRVNCDLYFNPFDVEAINRHGLRYLLKCSLWGDDPVWDDSLFTFFEYYWIQHEIVGGTENYKFQADCPPSLLNEDWGTDEIYGQLILRGYPNNTIQRRNTNVISRRF